MRVLFTTATVIFSNIWFFYSLRSFEDIWKHIEWIVCEETQLLCQLGHIEVISLFLQFDILVYCCGGDNPAVQYCYFKDTLIYKHKTIILCASTIHLMLSHTVATLYSNQGPDASINIKERL